MRMKWMTFAFLFVVSCGDNTIPNHSTTASKPIGDDARASPGPNQPSTSGSPDSSSDSLSVPEFGSPDSVKFTVVVASKDGLDTPRDLSFNPAHPEQLWIANRGFNGVVIAFDAGTSKQKTEKRSDTYADHFMDQVSSISFGNDNTFASCQESRNENNPSAPDFMGPTLWTADLSIFAKVNQKSKSVMSSGHLPNMGPAKASHCVQSVASGEALGSHIDMLHESPLCMGIANENANVYWAFDGLNKQIVRYDFQKDHGPGGSDHSDGMIRRFPEASLTRVAGVSGHLKFDKDTHWLYAADTGGHRVIRLKTDSGKFSKNLSGAQEQIKEYSQYGQATVEVFISDQLKAPSGIAISKNRLFVSDNATGEIFAFDLASKKQIGKVATHAKSIMGITFSPDGKLWYTDAAEDEVVRIDPK